MNKATLPAILVVSGMLIAAPGIGQDPSPCSDRGANNPACAPAATHTTSCHWAQGCFPRCGCPDDYCPHPYPPPCWPPYPSFYQCVPAGAWAPSTYGVPGKDRISLWFIPTPLTLREALWLHHP
jgi:hypothetical protein